MPDWKQQYTHILSGLGQIIVGSWNLYHVHDVIILKSPACLNYIKFIKQDLFIYNALMLLNLQYNNNKVKMTS